MTSVVVDGFDFAGNWLPVLVERQETQQGPTVHVFTDQRRLVLSSTLLDNIQTACASVLADPTP